MVAGWRSSADTAAHIVTVGRAEVAPASRPMTAATRFDLASLTKPLVIGTLSLLAMRERLIGLETRLGDLLRESSGTPIGSRTVRQLLTHTSGLPAWEPIYAHSGCDPDRALEALLALTVTEPDEHVVYSCPGFIVLGWALERVNGTPLDRLYRQRVLQPLGLERSLGFRPCVGSDLAAGSRDAATETGLLMERGIDPGSIPAMGTGLPDDGNARFLSGVSGNAGLFGTIGGVLDAASAFLDGGRLLTADEIILATTNFTSGREQARGLAWQLAPSPCCSAGSALSARAFGHTGFTGTSAWIDPDRELVMVLLANRTHPGHRDTDLHPLRRRFHELVCLG
jgi:CubicO group peptidase (beta-lactamase class C family)